MDYKILVLDGKHGSEFYKAFTNEDEIKSCWSIFNQHYNMGYYSFPPEHQKTADKIKETKDNGMVVKFVRLRSNQGHEYEHIEEVNLI